MFAQVSCLGEEAAGISRDRHWLPSDGLVFCGVGGSHGVPVVSTRTCLRLAMPYLQAGSPGRVQRPLAPGVSAGRRGCLRVDGPGAGGMIVERHARRPGCLRYLISVAARLTTVIPFIPGGLEWDRFVWVMDRLGQLRRLAGSSCLLGVQLQTPAGAPAERLAQRLAVGRPRKQRMI